MILDSRKKYGKVCPFCLSRSPFYNLFVSLSYKCLVQERHTSIFLFFPVSDLINIWWLIFGKKHFCENKHLQKKMKLSSRHCTNFFHMVSVYQGFGNMNEKSKKWKSILSGKSICVHFNFRVNPVVMILPLAGRTLLMAECKKVPTVGRNKELTLSEQLAMLTHHAGPLKSTLHDCNCSSCLTLYLYLY